MQVKVASIAGCPHAGTALTRTRAALDGLGLRDVRVEQVVVGTRDEAVAIGFAGSPTILVDGADLFPMAASTSALACRLYRSEEGLEGAPSAVAIAAALRVRLARA